MRSRVHTNKNKQRGSIEMQTLTSRPSNSGRWARFLGTGALAAAAAAALVAAAAPASAAPPTNVPVGASGSVAALSASSMEVQNPSSGQTTVTWTGTTQFSKTVTESVASLIVGDCVTATGTKSKSSKTTVAARSLTVTTSNSSGTCTGIGTRFGGTGTTPSGFPGRGGGGGFAFRGGETPGGTRPSFAPGPGASNFRNALASLDIVSGKVTAVKGSTVTVSGFTVSPGSFGRSSRSSSSSRSKKPNPPKTETLKVTTSGSTTVSATQTAAASDLAVGDCVSAFGPSAANGSVTASTVRITSTGASTCSGRFAGPGGGAGGFFGGPGGGAGA